MCVWLLLPAHFTRSLPPLHITLSSLVHWCPLPTVARKTMPWTTAHNHNCCKQKRQQLGATSRFKKVCVNTVSYGFIWFYVWFVSAHHSFAQGSRSRTLAVFGCFCLTEMPWYAGSISLWFKSIYNHLYVADIGRCFEPKINSPEVDWHLSKWLFGSTLHCILDDSRWFHQACKAESNQRIIKQLVWLGRWKPKRRQGLCSDCATSHKASS